MRARDEGPPERGNPQEPDALAGEVQGGSDEIGRLPSRLDRLAVAKGRALENLAYLRAYQGPEDFTYLVPRIHECGVYLAFRNYFTLDRVLLSGGANFCRAHLLCPFCAVRRGAKALKAYLERYQAVMRANPHLRLYLVTLTVKNGPDLAERHDHLKTAVKAILGRRRSALAGRRVNTEWAKVRAIVGSYEVTNKGKGWHPHVHMLVLVDKRLDAQAMKDEWLRITGDSHVLRIDTPRHPDDPARDFLEVFKYAVKFSDLSPAQNFEAFLQLRGKRLLFSVGLFRNVEIPEDLTDDLPAEDVPYIEMLYQYLEGAYHLEKTREYTPN